MMMNRWFGFLFLVVVAISSTTTEAVNHSSIRFNESASINFLAIGDWGGTHPDPPEDNSHPNQRLVARGMAKVASRFKPQFVLALGDNFYFNGVPRDADDAHERITETFEKVYTDPSLASAPWYVIAGNHDYRGDVQCQIDYTSSTKTSGRWQFPSLYHAHSFSSSRGLGGQQDETNTHDNGITVDVILIDTVELSSLNDMYEPLPLLSKSHAKDQWSWIERELSKSQADYLLVGGHYPVYSICAHGPTPTLVKHLQPLLEKYDAHYLAGHEHGMMHWQVEDSNVNYILNGAGSACCCDSSNWDNDWNPPATDDNLKWYLDNEKNRDLDKKVKGGFLSFQANEQSMQVLYHDETGNVLFQPDPILPRTSPAKKKHSVQQEEEEVVLSSVAS